MFWRDNGKALFILLLAVLGTAWHGFRINTPVNQWNQVISQDGKGYYAYLPALFIYHDSSYNFLEGYEKKYYLPGGRTDFRKGAYGRDVNKYFCGEAILVSPFFAAAHVYALALHLPADGYSAPYQYAVLAATLFYLFWGLWFLYLLLRGLGFSFRASIVSVVLTLLGTNLFYYATREASMSHVYSFSLMCAFLYAVRTWFISPERKYLIYIGITLALILVVRPSNGLVVLFLPFVAGSWLALRDGIKRLFSYPAAVVLGLVLFSIPLFIQCWLWHWQTGHWFVYAYGGETFHFSEPHFFDFLFSYRKGWFLWTPLALVGILGYFFYLRSKPWQFVTALGFLIIVAYVLSCWWMWYYGYSFGSRAMVDFLFLMAIGIAAAFQGMRTALAKIGFSTFCLGLMVVNLIQTYQYRHYILLGDGTSQTDYWKVFLKTGRKYEGLLWQRFIKPKPEVPLLTDADSTYTNDFEMTGWWEGDEYRFPDEARSGKYATRVDKEHDYSVTWKKRIDSSSRDSFIQASLWFTGEYMPAQAALVISMEDKGRVVFWQETDLKDFFNPNKKWNKAVLQRSLPVPLPRADKLQVFVWNKNSGDIVYLDDMRVDIFERKR